MFSVIRLKKAKSVFCSNADITMFLMASLIVFLSGDMSEMKFTDNRFQTEMNCNKDKEKSLGVFLMKCAKIFGQGQNINLTFFERIMENLYRGLALRIW